MNRSKRAPGSALLNAPLLKKFGAKQPKEGNDAFVRVANTWTVEIYPDLDGKLQAGEIEVYSDLGAPEQPEYGLGSLTRRIYPKGADPEPEPQAGEQDSAEDSAPTVATSAPPPASEPVTESAQKIDDTKGRAFAFIRYADQQGQKVMEVTKNQIVIGRGGRSYWVDLKLETLPDVSREHCRIRRDAETGRFTIEDLSQFGTAVNGAPVGKNNAAELPRRSTISLAGVIDLQWESV
jgi:predicted component of type VI protein secretion system